MAAYSRSSPVNTYRLQLTPDFGFAAAVAAVPYLQRLGITHLYCSPWLQSAPGSQHGYDIVDHARVNDELGGAEGLAGLAGACHEAGLGIILDIVPNHMAISEPESQNRAWWSVLRDGPASPYAAWFDLDWSLGKLLLPVLGKPLAESLDELVMEPDRIRYYDHEFPLAPGTLVPGDLTTTLESQHYRLALWRTGSDELTHRRFFDVTSLAGLRVEDPAVFDATHALILEQVGAGIVDGLRVDHPDGLADPEGYLARLAEQSGGIWTVAEKILEPGERLPARWQCAGTTGYDALHRVQALFVEPSGEQPLTDLWQELTGDTSSYEDHVSAAKHQILDRLLAAEVDRLVEIAVPLGAHLDVTRRGLREALVEVLTAFTVYRAYLPATGPADEGARAQVEAAVTAAQAALPHRAREATVIGRLALADGLLSPEFVTRFQQTCGPVMAKAVEDTTFYRYLRLSALCEVGGDPSLFGLDLDGWHAGCQTQQREWPLTMTTLSTHDTKRSEDVRARLVLLSQCPQQWRKAVTQWGSEAPLRLDPATQQLIWQTLVGAWPISSDRAVAYLEKATREAKCHTSWTDPDATYDDDVAAFVRAVLAHPQLCQSISSFVEGLAAGWRVTVLAQKLVQLTMPGVADTYQGAELVDLSLVDPDNRRPVDYARRLTLLDAPDDSLDGEKLKLVSTTLRLRREHPEWFVGDATYDALDAGSGALAFCRSGRVVTVVPLRGMQGAPTGSVTLPSGAWTDRLTGNSWTGSTPLPELLKDFPVALLVRS